MNMVRHAIDLEHFMAVPLENTCDVLMQSFFPFIADQRFPVFYSENKLNMNLGIAIWHTWLNLNAKRSFTNRSYGTKITDIFFSTDQTFLWNEKNLVDTL